MNTHVIDTPEFDSGKEAKALNGSRGPMDWIKSLYVGYRDWMRYRAAVSELSAMDDTRLADIGIIRGDIRAMVRQSMDGASRRTGGTHTVA